MGVTNLWQILEPVKQHVPLSSLRGKTLAVDLSLWVCEAQTVKKMKGVVTKPHLRNLYFRVSSLTLMGIHLVFVMEGEPPKLKASTMEKRTEVRFGPSKKPRTARTRRSRFKSLLKECLEMLEYLGVPWVQAAGEAEAMCAYLNASGVVDGCLTNDGDAFLYGARTIYRNFTMNLKDPHVDCYLMTAVEEKLGCSRESLIGLAVLLGCDYLPKGVPGIGKEQSLKLIRTLKGQNLLQRFEHWKGHFQSCDIPPLAVKKVVHCTMCRHPGSYTDHKCFGCHLCGSVGYCEPHSAEYLCPCDWHTFEQRQEASAVEESMRKKAQMCEGFPFPEVIEEYLTSKDKPVRLKTSQRPSLLSFQNFAFEKMEWTKHYACEKLCVLLTYYDMNRRKSGHTDPQQLQALRIVKHRIKNGIPCFEVEWRKPEHYVTADDQPVEPFIRTTEEASLFQAAYPEVVAMYQLEKLQVCKERKKGKKSRLKEKESSAKDSEIADLLSRLTLDSTCETFPGKSTKSSCLKFPAKDSESQHLSAAAYCSTEVSKSQKQPLTSPIVTSQNPEENCNLVGSRHSQEKLTKQLIASSAVSPIADLQLSSIDWEATSFSVSPKLVNMACYLESESGMHSDSTRPHSVLCWKTAETIGPSSDDPHFSSSVDDAASCIDLPKGQNDLSLKEKAVLEASSKAAHVSPLSPFQSTEQMNSLGEACSSPSTQRKDSAQPERMGLPEIYLRVPMLRNDKKAPPNSQYPVRVIPMVLKSSLKKSVCQNYSGYSSEDSDGEVMRDKRKAHKIPKWLRKSSFVQPEDKRSEKKCDNERVLETQQRREEPACKLLSKDLPVSQDPGRHVPNPPRPTECKSGGSCSHLEDSGSDSDTQVHSPLPLSERLKLKLQNR
ncbi:flap endonuclease GEN homolog 1 [Pogona vitticeps]